MRFWIHCAYRGMAGEPWLMKLQAAKRTEWKNIPAMPRQLAKKVNLQEFPEFPVKREVICSLFTHTMPRSTFYDRVKTGQIVSMPELPGYYPLNATLHRLGLPLVRQLSDPPESRSLEEIVRLAFTLIDRNLFPEPSWLLRVKSIEARDADHAVLLASRYRDTVSAFEHVELKLAYFQGVLDWVSLENSPEAVQSAT